MPYFCLFQQLCTKEMNIVSQLQVAVFPADTHPIIQSIINNKLTKLKKLLKDHNIDDVYSCREWRDSITPLIAAVVYHNRDICTFLLQEDADPNRVSKNGLTPLHYASQSKAPLFFVEKLLEAKADPNGFEMQRFTPLQMAAISDREDISKALISAGAKVLLLSVTDPEHNFLNEKISQMVHNIALKGDELCSKIKHFLDVQIAVQKKTPQEVFKTFEGHMLLEDPQTHLTMIEMLFNVTGRVEDKYRQGVSRLKLCPRLKDMIEHS